MDDYFKDWLTVIDGMNNENTYKLAWGRAIIELCHSFDVVEGVPTVFTFEQIGEYVLKYFWNQTYFFKLYQGPAKSKPKIQQITEEVIEYYQSITQSKISDWFDKSKPILLRNKVKYNRFLKEISTALKQDVCWRFLLIDGEEIQLYLLNKSKKKIILTSMQHRIIRKYYHILNKLICFQWIKLLIKFNKCLTNLINRIVVKNLELRYLLLKRDLIKEYTLVEVCYERTITYDLERDLENELWRIVNGDDSFILID